MASAKPFQFGPIALTNSIADLLNPPAASGGTNAGSSAQKILLRQLRIANKTGSPATFQLYKGLTGGNAAGTEVDAKDRSVPANSSVVIPFGGDGLVLLSTDFLSGLASANTTLTIEGQGFIVVAG